MEAYAYHARIWWRLLSGMLSKHGGVCSGHSHCADDLSANACIPFCTTVYDVKISAAVIVSIMNTHTVACVNIRLLQNASSPLVL